MNTIKLPALITVVATATFLLTTNVTAQSVSGAPSNREEAAQRLDERMEDISQRLDLSDDQRAQAESIIRASFERRQALLEEAQADGSLSFREKRNLRQSMNEESDRMMRELDGILTPSQLAELGKIQDEQRAKMRAELEQQR